MPNSPKVFSSSAAATSRRSLLRRLLSSPAVSAACLLFGLAGFLAAAISVAWDRRPGDAAGGATELPAGHATGSRGRHKVMAFVGIFTGFGSVGRRRTLRRTWLPSDRQGLLRLVGGGAARRSRPAATRSSGRRRRRRHRRVVS
uniref:Hexosyltransferase n=1 Tax=Hordeum vulgare subsp. vulgare TaxID=112509 RepID=A0A8I6YKD3_HORVV